MATLHVRNVPDVLYERLRECATANGRSIGAEVIVLIERRVVEDVSQKPRIFRGGSRRRRPSSPFQHFDPPARNVIVAAREEAVDRGSPGIGTEHMLLVLLQEPPHRLTQLLERSGLDYAAARAIVEAAADPEAAAPAGALPLTPAAKKALELALRESLSLGAGSIGREHLLLGISRVHESLGAQILAGAMLHWPVLHRELLMRSDEPAIETAEEPVPYSGFRVVELDGPAEEWERLLNSHAASGHELVEIVEKRAIFRVPVL